MIKSGWVLCMFVVNHMMKFLRQYFQGKSECNEYIFYLWCNWLYLKINLLQIFFIIRLIKSYQFYLIHKCRFPLLPYCIFPQLSRHIIRLISPCIYTKLFIIVIALNPYYISFQYRKVDKMVKFICKKIIQYGV